MELIADEFCRRSCVIALGLFLFSGSLAASEPGEGLSSAPESIDWAIASATVPFDLTLDKPSVLARVNGTGPYLFLLDTAVSGATLDDNVARQSGVKMRTEGTSELGYIAELNIGGVNLNGVEVAIHDWDLEEHGYRRFAGTLGLSVFESCLLTVDYPGLKVSLTQGHLAAADGLQILDYKKVGGFVAVPFRFGDTTVNALLDTGSVQSFVLNESLRGKIAMVPVAEESSNASESGRASGNVRLGGFGFVEPPVEFHDKESMVGQLALYHFRLTIDQKNQRVRFLGNQDTYITFGGHSRLGLSVERKGRVLRVTHIVPGTPACRRGLRVGDVIEGINRQLSPSYDLAEIARLLDESDRVLLHVKSDGHNLLFRLDAE